MYLQTGNPCPASIQIGFRTGSSKLKLLPGKMFSFWQDIILSGNSVNGWNIVRFLLYIRKQFQYINWET